MTARDVLIDDWPDPNLHGWKGEATRALDAIELEAAEEERKRIRRRFARYRTIIATGGVTLDMVDAILREP